MRKTGHMTADQDPVQRAADDDMDLYDVVTWEPRSRLDYAATWLYNALGTGLRPGVLVVAALIIVAQFATATGLVFFDRPVVGAYVLLSVAPALAVAGYIWLADATGQEPIELLVATFVFGFLFAGFAAAINAMSSVVLFGSSDPMTGSTAVATSALFYFLVVGPVEEIVKWLAVRLYVFRSDEFDTVVDGAVYGAMAGLGFATVENAIYILREVMSVMQTAGGQQATEVAFQVAALRTLAGPGHVIYSAFAGYYLGLAKFNPDDAGPIVVKGLVTATLIHATYNTAVTNLKPVAEFVGVAQGVAFLVFVIAYDGVFLAVLGKKLRAYRAAYNHTGASAVAAHAATWDGDALEPAVRRIADDGVGVDPEDYSAASSAPPTESTEES